MYFPIERTIRAVSRAPLVVAALASIAGCDDLPAPNVPPSARTPVDSGTLLGDGGVDSNENCFDGPPVETPNDG